MAQNQPERGQRGLPGGSPRYSAFALAKKAMNYHQDWQRAWRDPEPKSEYDASNQRQIMDALTTLKNQLNFSFQTDFKNEQDTFNWFIS